MALARNQSLVFEAKASSSRPKPRTCVRGPGSIPAHPSAYRGCGPPGCASAPGGGVTADSCVQRSVNTTAPSGVYCLARQAGRDGAGPAVISGAGAIAGAGVIPGPGEPELIGELP